MKEEPKPATGSIEPTKPRVSGRVIPKYHAPATGEQNPSREEIYDEMTAHIKGDKATGAWTVERLESFVPSLTNRIALCKEINAAIAAERDAKLGWRKIAERQTNDAEQLREQLARERELNKLLPESVFQLKEQLAAETDRCDSFKNLCLGMERQLAAAKAQREWTARFVMKEHAIFDNKANAFVGLADACYLLDDAYAALAAERKGHEMDGQLISSQEVEIQQLHTQLAAEIKQHQAIHGDLDRMTETMLENQNVCQPLVQKITELEGRLSKYEQS